MTNTTKPKYVQEVEKNLGLTCLLDPTTAGRSFQEYYVMSPTGLCLFKIGGTEDDIIGMVSTPEMHTLQGISKDERHKRMRD